MKLIEAIKQKRLYLDGGTGTTLISRGIITKNPELLNSENPEEILNLHLDFLNAGADIILTNTFGVNSFKCSVKYPLADYAKSGINLARKAVHKIGKENRYVLYDCGPLGELLYPFGSLKFEDAYNAYKEIALAVAAEDIDGIMLETFTDLAELRCAVLAFSENTDFPIFASMCFEKDGRTYTGAGVESFASVMQALNVAAVGINCGSGPDLMKSNAKLLNSCTHLPVFVKPNAGLPVFKDGKTLYNLTAHEFANQTAEIGKSGISILGGCCGTSPEFISALKTATENISVTVKAAKLHNVCSSSCAVKIAEKNQPLIIGEKVNPTGKPLLRAALKDKNFDYVLSLCMEQVRDGADLLDINVGMAGGADAELLPAVVERVQAVAGLPLVIDTTDSIALENALRVYCGVPVINSVNGEKKSMDKVFPLTKKYGAYLVALCLDEDGIPSDSDKTVQIAKKIACEALKYGIDSSRLLFDPLTLTVATGKDNALRTLNNLDRLTELGFNTVLGLSNVSFGLPNREKINATFFEIIKGKASFIIANPALKPYMHADARALIMGEDDALNTYISNNSVSPPPPQAQILTITDCIINGLATDGLSAVRAAVNAENFAAVIDNEIICGLNELGALYEKGRAFLPQLLAGSETAKIMLDYIKENFMSESQTYKSIMVLATVKGDVHDIGKNIVKAVLSNYGVKIIDLGRDVPTQTIIDAVKTYKPKTVGLSALMTTTLPSMAEAARAIRKTDESVTVLVGGAVVTEEFAASIGAVYCKDALSAVKAL